MGYFRLALLVLLAGVATARAQDQTGNLANCTTGGTACVGTVVAQFDRLTVAVTKTSGTMSLDLDCQVRDAADGWETVATGITASQIVSLCAYACYALRVHPQTCSSCVYTATYRGFPAAK